MGYSALERTKIAEKFLQTGTFDSDPRTQGYESTNLAELSLYGSKIWLQEELLRNNPAPNIATANSLTASGGNLDGVVANYTGAEARKLTALPGIDFTWVVLDDPDNPNFQNRLKNWIQPTMIPQSNGLPSFGFATRLYDGDPNSGGTEILTSDGQTGIGLNAASAWFFQPAGGVLGISDDFYSETGIDSNTFEPWIEGFQYIGRTALDSITTEDTAIVVASGIDPDLVC